MLPGWEDGDKGDDWEATNYNEPEFYEDTFEEEMETVPEPVPEPMKKPAKRRRGRAPPRKTNHQNPSFFSDSINNQVAAAAVEQSYTIMEQKFGHYFKASVFSLDYYKYYFCVDNKYVLNKLKLIFLPFLSHNWKREEHFIDGSNSEVQYLVPKKDLNAPDGYLLLMAFVTYIILMYILVGMKEKNISPEVIGRCASSALGVMVFQTILFRIGFYFLNVSILAPGWLDNLCYSGYKLIPVLLNLLVFLVSSSLTAYYIVSIITGLLSAYFLVNTLLPFFNFGSSIKRPFVGIMALVEVLLVQVLGRIG